jgi:hypothetical protein
MSEIDTYLIELSDHDLHLVHLPAALVERKLVTAPHSFNLVRCHQ